MGSAVATCTGDGPKTRHDRTGQRPAFHPVWKGSEMTLDPMSMPASGDVYCSRRRRLAAELLRPMVVFAGRPIPRNYADNTHPFRPGSTYSYFGGPPVEGAAWLIAPGSDGDEGCTLLRPDIPFEHKVWLGDTPPDTALAAAAGIEVGSVKSSDGLERELAGREAAAIVPACMTTAKQANALGLQSPDQDELLHIIDMRLIKDEHELAGMRRAADIGIEAHRAAMRATEPGRRESDVAAAFHAVLVANQCLPSFTPLVTVRGEVLHRQGYTNAMAAGDLLLVDGGAEEPGGYASDITRTYPVNGSFSTDQKRFYEIVLRAEREAMAACVPGKRFRDIHDLAARVLCEGLVAEDLLRGDPAELAERRAHTLFFSHGVGHLIGMDVHDMEDFGDLAGYAIGRTRRTGFGDKFLRLDRDLQPGMTLTIEPGFYVSPAIWRQDDLIAPFADCVNRPAVDRLIDANFGGIRIEDNVHVLDASATGPEIFTQALPTDADEVTALVAGA